MSLIFSSYQNLFQVLHDWHMTEQTHSYVVALSLKLQACSSSHIRVQLPTTLISMFVTLQGSASTKPSFLLTGICLHGTVVTKMITMKRRFLPIKIFVQLYSCKFVFVTMYASPFNETLSIERVNAGTMIRPRQGYCQHRDTIVAPQYVQRTSDYTKWMHTQPITHFQLHYFQSLSSAVVPYSFPSVVILPGQKQPSSSSRHSVGA